MVICFLHDALPFSIDAELDGFVTIGAWLWYDYYGIPCNWPSPDCDDCQRPDWIDLPDSDRLLSIQVGR